MALDLSAEQVLRHRFRLHQLDRPQDEARAATDAAVLGFGVQDTGPDGALWALAVRGVPVRAHEWPAGLALAWTLRGAPHAYRRADLPDVQRALRPFSDEDAGKRVYDAAKHLRAASIRPLDGWAHAARVMHGVVAQPMSKGAVSTAMTAAIEAPYVRWCRPCGATHMWEMTFRLAALHAGLELEPDTAPPVLRRIPGWRSDRVGRVERAGGRPDGDVDVIRQAVRFLGPTTPRLVAEFVEAPLADVRARWPDDVVPVSVEGRPAWILADDQPALLATIGSGPPGVVRLLGPYDLFMQARDRELQVGGDVARRRALWPTLGRPGAVVVDGTVVGTWRPRARGKRLALELDEWAPWSARVRTGVDAQHEALAGFRGMAPS